MRRDRNEQVSEWLSWVYVGNNSMPSFSKPNECLPTYFHMQNVYRGKFLIRDFMLLAIGCELRYQANVIYNVICLLFNLLFIWGVACLVFPILFGWFILFSHPLLFWLICLSRSMKSIRIQNVITVTLKTLSTWFLFWVSHKFNNWSMWSRSPKSHSCSCTSYPKHNFVEPELDIQ